MAIRKILEAVCDYCGNAISHDYDVTRPQMKNLVRNYGGIIQKDKCFCDQACANKWWVKKTKAQL